MTAGREEQWQALIEEWEARHAETLLQPVFKNGVATSEALRKWRELCDAEAEVRRRIEAFLASPEPSP